MNNTITFTCRNLKTGETEPAQRDVCGSYPGAVPYTIWTDERAEELAERLASAAGCAYYTVDGETYGPYPRADLG